MGRAWAVVFACLVVAGVSHASEPEVPFGYVAPVAGWLKLDEYDPGTPRGYVHAGARAGWRPWGIVGFELAGGRSESVTLRSIYYLSGGLVAEPVRYRYGGPFVGVGAGYLGISGANPGPFNVGTFDLSAGWQYWATRGIGVRLEFRNILAMSQHWDDSNKHQTVLTGGITLGLGGGLRDADRDGIADRRDKCADTPLGAIVTPDGCAKDSDSDGVVDGVDQESATRPGAVVDARGVSRDDDGDGVPNGIDRDPTTRSGRMVDPYGVPVDEDHDGVDDPQDRCPGTPPQTAVNAEGCPVEVSEIEESLVDLGVFREENILFETGQAAILPASAGRLGKIGLALSGLPELLFEVQGHCDDRGTSEFNLQLSEQRAQNVIEYLVARFSGVQRAQLAARGFGKSKPLTPGTDDVSRERNRRVEFVVLNPEKAKRQVERKRQLLRGEAPPDTIAAPRQAR